jgi:hypothetical protein
VALLDSDDIWMPWKAQAQVACLERLPDAGMIWTEMEAIDADGSVFSRRYLRTMYSAYRWFSTEDLFDRAVPASEVLPGVSELAHGTLYGGDIFSQMVMGNLVHTSTVMLRRERLARVRGFDEDLKPSGEDYDFHLRTCREGPVAFLDVPAIQYQRGMPDRLTRPEYAIHVSSNFLRTIERLLERDRDRIKLPGEMINAVRAEAHMWVGEMLLAGGDRAGARRQLAKSLAREVIGLRSARLLLAAMLPPPAVDLLRRLKRTVL